MFQINVALFLIVFTKIVFALKSRSPQATLFSFPIHVIPPQKNLKSKELFIHPQTANEPRPYPTLTYPIPNHKLSPSPTITYCIKCNKKNCYSKLNDNYCI